MRKLLVVLATALSLPTAGFAQVELTANVGLHLDRTPQAHRMLLTGPNSALYSARGEAPAVGVRGAYWFFDQVGAQAGILTSRNTSSFGGGPGPLPDLIKRTTFISVAAVWRVLPAGSRALFDLSIGPAAVVHSGSGESLLTRQTDLGVAGSAAASLRISPALRIGIDVQNYRFRSDFRISEGPDGRLISRGEVVPRSEWLVLPAIHWRW